MERFVLISNILIDQLKSHQEFFINLSCKAKWLTMLLNTILTRKAGHVSVNLKKNASIVYIQLSIGHCEAIGTVVVLGG